MTTYRGSVSWHTQVLMGCVFLAVLAAGPAAAQTMIYDVVGLQAVRVSGAGSYALANDIDASDTVNWNLGAGFDPIGFPGLSFVGQFNGNGYTITGLYIYRPTQDNVGLFGYCGGGMGATIQNVRLEGATITGRDDVGGIAGWGMSTGVTGCSVEGFVAGRDEVGGVMGHNNMGSISSCRSEGVVLGEDFVGGMLGKRDFGSGAASQCYSTATVTATGNTVGGLIGQSVFSSDVADSYARGDVSGNTNVGGLVGEFGFSTMTNCYSAGLVTGSSPVGGLVGTASTPTFISCYWDTQTSGQPGSAGGTGMITAAMMQQATFVGWTFGGVWGIVENVTYPYPGALLATESVSVTIDVGATQPDPANTLPVSFDAVFSAPVTGFDNTDVDFSGGAVTVTSYTVTDTGAGMNYTVDVTGLSGDGAVVATIPADVCMGLASFPNLASTSTDNEVTFDSTLPTVTLSCSAPDPTDSPFEVTATVTESVSDFTSSDVSVTNGSVSGFSGSGTSYSWTVNPSSQGTVSCYVPPGLVHDAAGNPNPQSNTISRMYNACPEAQDPSLIPASPRTGDDLTVIYTYYDADGDPQEREQVRWFRNGKRQDAYKNQNPLPASATAKGEEWYANVRVFDGYCWSVWAPTAPVTILNTPPEIVDPVISLPEPHTDDKLPLSYEYSDADGDPMTRLQVFWYKYEPSKKKFIRQTVYDNKERLPASATKKGDQWKAKLRAKNWNEWGPWSITAPVTILNTPPEARDVLISPPSPQDEDDLTLSFSYDDADGDPNTNRQIRWFKDNVRQDAYKNSTRVAHRFTSPGEEWVAKVRFFDGEEWGPLCPSPPVIIGAKAPESRATGQGEFEFTVLPQGGWFEEGESFILSVGVSGAVGLVTYQWTKDGLELAGETFWTYEVAGATSYDEGAYTCRATDEAKAVSDETPPAFVRVFRAGSLPAAGVIGLCIAVMACVSAGAFVISRKRTY